MVQHTILQMIATFTTMVVILVGILSMQVRNASSVESRYLPDPKKEPSKYAYEMFTLAYTPIWISIFGVVVVFQLYESFDAFTYNTLLGSLALPLVLQPIFLPSAGVNSPDKRRHFTERYSTKANLWIAVYSFIGNYWYTHYFYSVLRAEYTMPATRLNNVPICMYFATHFYFSTYHVFSNALLRKVVTTYKEGLSRSILFISVVATFSYLTAFLETLSISSFPYYRFEDRDMAYTVGSAFYGIYFLVSFPAFFTFDQDIDQTKASTASKITLWDTFVSSAGHCMMILTLLDFVRLYLDIPLIVGA
jgi:cycloeucalenol cycloisomerase